MGALGAHSSPCARLTQSISCAALTELSCIDLCIVFCKDCLILARVVSSIKTDG